MPIASLACVPYPRLGRLGPALVARETWPPVPATPRLLDRVREALRIRH